MEKVIMKAFIFGCIWIITTTAPSLCNNGIIILGHDAPIFTKHMVDMSMSSTGLGGREGGQICTNQVANVQWWKKMDALWPKFIISGFGWHSVTSSLSLAKFCWHTYYNFRECLTTILLMSCAEMHFYFVHYTGNYHTQILYACRQNSDKHIFIPAPFHLFLQMVALEA